MDWTTVVLLLIILVLSYSIIDNRIPSRLHPEQAPKSEFGIVPVSELTSNARSQAPGVEYGCCSSTLWAANLKQLQHYLCTWAWIESGYNMASEKRARRPGWPKISQR
jgi:hypothetical protein